MVSCTIRGCGKRTGRDKVRLFCIPTVITRECDKTLLFSRSRRAVWLDRINQGRRLLNVQEMQESDIKPHIKVCSMHFLSGQPSKLFEEKSVDWAPSCNLGYEIENPVAQQEYKIHEVNGFVYNQKVSELITSDIVTGYVPNNPVGSFIKVEKRGASDDEDEMCNRVKRNSSSQVNWVSWTEESQHEPQVKLKVFDDDFEQWGQGPSQCSSSVQTEVRCSSVCVQTEDNGLSVEVQTVISRDDIVDKQQFDCVTQDNVALRAELQNLKQYVLSESMLAKNNSLVKFYTGVPTFTLLKQVFDLVSAKIQYSYRNALSQFQEFLIIMMRLRLNLLEQDLGFRFGVSQPTVSKICDRWLRGMATILEGEIPWPVNDACDKASTEVFRRAFGSKRVVIVSCFEVVCDKFKQRKTVQYVIGITPQGKICFISSGVINSMSDRALMERSGILDKLSRGDVLLADRGFNIAGCSGIYQANPKFLIFTKGKTDLPSEDWLISTTVNIRTYVERINNVVKQKFRILQNSVSPELLTAKPGETEATIDYIVHICCALTNMCPSYGDD